MHLLGPGPEPHPGAAVFTTAVTTTPEPISTVRERRAWVDHGRIVVGEPILFEQGTAHTLPVSLPVLAAGAARGGLRACRWRTGALVGVPDDSGVS